MIRVDIERLVPRFILRDKNGYALARAIEAALSALNETVADGVKTLSDYDAMPEWRLDELAWETGCLYDYNADIETKRETIRNSLRIWRTIGTKGAVQTAVRALFPDGEVIEWFEYGGAPYAFRVILNAEPRAGDDARLAELRRSVEFYKNVRSTLDGIEYVRRAGDTLWHGCGYVTRQRQVVACDVPADMALNYIVDERGIILMDELCNYFYDNEEAS